MSNSPVSVQIHQRMQFSTLSGDVLTVDVGSVRRSGSDSVVATFFLTDDAWEQALESGSFHLDSVTDYPSLEPGQTVELRVRLRPVVSETVTESLSELQQRLADSVDPLRHTESWFATGVLQEMELPAEFDGILEPDTAASVGVDTDWNDFLDTSSSTTVLEEITAFFDDESAYERPEENMIQTEMRIGEDRQFPLYIYADEEARECQIYAVHPKQVPESARPAVTEVIATRNFELERGSFGLNPADGTVRFRLGVHVDEESVVDAINTNVSAMTSVFETVQELADDA